MHPMQVIVQVTHHGARPPPLLHCPPALARLMERCWQEEPAERWGTAGACASNLRPLPVAVKQTAILKEHSPMTVS